MGHVQKVSSLAYMSPVKSVSSSFDRTLKVWDLVKGYCIKTLFTLSSPNVVIPLSEDVLVSGHLDSFIRLWDVRSGTMISEISTGATQVTSLTALGSKTRILAMSRDDCIKEIDIRELGILNTYTDKEFKVPTNYSQLFKSPDESFFGAGGVNGTLYFWDLQSGKCTTLKKSEGTIIGGAFDSSGKLWAVERERSLLCFD